MNECGSGAKGGVERLLCPTSVAVVGASRRAGSIGAAIVSNIKRDGFRGPIYPINPQAESIAGLRCYPSVSAVGAPVDLAVIVVPAGRVEAVVDDCIASKVGGLLIITAGFAEASPAGREAEQSILAKVRRAGIRMVGPNCMGLINTNPTVRLNTTFTSIWPPQGNIAIASQSGALGLTILDQIKTLNLGISTFVSVGNKADVSSNDLLIYWQDDPNTDVIVLYLESFGNPRRFARIAPHVVRKKPIVAVKAGRSAAGTRAASSHSAALANLDVAVDALFEQAGVIRTNTLEEMYDVAALLATQPVPTGSRVGVVTNAGGPGILLADACEARGMTLPELTGETLTALRHHLPPHAGLANPIDLVASDSPELFERAVSLVGRDPNVDSVVVIFIPPLMTTRPEDVAQAIARAAGTIPEHKPVMCVFLSVRGTPDLLSSGPRRRIPCFSYAENAAMALAAAYKYGQWCRRPEELPFCLPAEAVARIRSVVERNLAGRDVPVWLGPPDQAAVFGAVGISMAESQVCTPAEAQQVARRLGFPLVAKAVAPGLVHKSDVGGVILGLQTDADVEAAVRKLKAAMNQAHVELEAVQLQREVRGGLEALVGVTTDPVFGPLLVCGLGGVLVELLKDVSFSLTPVGPITAREMLSKLRSAPLLDGYRGAPPADVGALVDLIVRVSALVEAVPELRELDLNPVKVLPPGQGAIAVDGRILIERWPSTGHRSTRAPFGAGGMRGSA